MYFYTPKLGQNEDTRKFHGVKESVIVTTHRKYLVVALLQDNCKIINKDFQS